MVFDIEGVDGEGLSFNLQINKAQFVLGLDDCFLSSDVQVNGKLTRVYNDIHLKGRVNTELNLNCSRCLDSYTRAIDCNLKARFAPLNHGPALEGEIELHALDIDTEFYEGHQVDITQSVRDGILLAIPFIRLCKNDCKGMCSECGKKLNQGYCNCVIEPLTDPRLDILKILSNKFKLRGG